MRKAWATFIPTVLIASALSLSGCAGKLGSVRRGAAVVLCAVKDDRLGTVVMDPKRALAWMRVTAARLRASAEKLRQGVPDDVVEEVRLLEDIDDLIGRMAVCIQGGGGDEATLQPGHRALARLVELGIARREDSDTSGTGATMKQLSL